MLGGQSQPSQCHWRLGSCLSLRLLLIRFFGLDNVLSRGIIDPQSIGCVLDCLLIFIDHVYELLALDGVDSVVAALGVARSHLFGPVAGSSGGGLGFDVAATCRKL